MAMHEERLLQPRGGGDTDTSTGEGLHGKHGSITQLVPARGTLGALGAAVGTGHPSPSQPTLPCVRAWGKIGWESSAKPNLVKGTSKENVMFPLPLVTLGTVGDGPHPWGVRMRRDPRLRQQSARSAAQKPGSESIIPWGFTQHQGTETV